MKRLVSDVNSPLYRSVLVYLVGDLTGSSNKGDEFDELWDIIHEGEEQPSVQTLYNARKRLDEERDLMLRASAMMLSLEDVLDPVKAIDACWSHFAPKHSNPYHYGQRDRLHAVLSVAVQVADLKSCYEEDHGRLRNHLLNQDLAKIAQLRKRAQAAKRRKAA